MKILRFGTGGLRTWEQRMSGRWKLLEKEWKFMGKEILESVGAAWSGNKLAHPLTNRLCVLKSQVISFTATPVAKSGLQQSMDPNITVSSSTTRLEPPTSPPCVPTAQQKC